GNLIIIDDPVKSRKEANSRAYRESVYNWYKDDLYTRLEPGAAIILIQTRWHEDDLGGRLLAEGEDEWVVISLPALAGESDPLGREPGAALCPERFNEEALARIQRTLGLSFFALYQQTPMPPEGDFFKRHWFEIAPVAPPPHRAWWVRYWDKASSQDEGDYTAGVLLALTKNTGEFFVVDVRRGQWESEVRDRVIRQTLALDEQAYGANLVTWFEQEGGASGKDAARATLKALAGHRVFAETVSKHGDKATRAEPFQAQAMPPASNVKLVSGAWNKAYLDELAAFPFGTNDDQVDGSSGALRRLTITQEQEQHKQGKSEAPATGKPRYVRTGLTR
ncbi:MAG: phage terminase large subunit, partial [Anaerolineae bacterium]|nr:phage terminase large subunit [Anaerolineae bacterium]